MSYNKLMETFCNFCGMCCKLIPIDLEKLFVLRDGLQELDTTFLDMLVPLTMEEAISINENYVQNVQNLFPDAKFFKCKYLTDDNLCTTFDKHEYCIKFPSHPLAMIPDDCGYYGEIFIKSEEVKQKVRKYKEEIVYYEAMIASGCKEEKVYRKIIDSLNKFINKYAPYGSADW